MKITKNVFLPLILYGMYNLKEEHRQSVFRKCGEDNKNLSLCVIS
jgi:hypothetical protein